MAVLRAAAALVMSSSPPIAGRCSGNTLGHVGLVFTCPRAVRRAARTVDARRNRQCRARFGTACCKAAVVPEQREDKEAQQSEPHVPVLMDEVLSSFRDVNLKVQ